jgi:predicted acyltransferase
MARPAVNLKQLHGTLGADHENLNKAGAVTVTERLMSLDALRGFDMFWIIGGDQLVRGLAQGTGSEFLKRLAVQFEHVEWQGFNFEDIIMPLFLFIAGVAMPFSFNKRLELGQTKKQLCLHILVRVVILWILGMIAQGNLLKYDLSQLYVYSNTLQAIAAGYLIASILMLTLSMTWQIAAMAGLLILFWALMTFVPVPGYGAGVLTPEGNFAVYIDNIILGRFCKHPIYYTWVLSSLTFAVTVMQGVFAGYLLRSQKSGVKKTLSLLATGAVCVVAGELWSITSPIIKHLWTSSFVLYSGGWCYILTGCFYLIIDVWKLRKWAFAFVVIGANAIAVYMACSVFDFKLVGNVFIGGLTERLGQWNSFVQLIAAIAVIWLILYWMYRKKSFIKI